MKIGFDAKWFFHGPPSGRTVVVSHAQHLLAIQSDHEIYLFLDRRMRDHAFPFEHPRLHRVYVWADNNLLANLWSVPRAAYRIGLDVVIFQNFVPIRAHFARVAFVYDVIFESHPQYYTWKERLYFRPLKLLSRRAERICTLSASEKARIAHYKYGRPEVIDIVPLGVDPRFKPREAHDPSFLAALAKRLRLPPHFLLFVGRLNVRKNLLNLLKAVALMRDQQVPLVIVGARDWKMFDVNALIESLGIRVRVMFTGSLPEEELRGVYALATVFCFPSFEEGFGLPPIEAMASGLPVVVSDRASLPEICGPAGTYVDPHEPSAIAHAIDCLLEDPALRARKRAEGLERAKGFTWEASAQALLASAIAAVGAR